MAPDSAVIVAIDRAWDGGPALPGEVVHLELALDASGLRIDVDAPWHGDPAPAGPAGPTDRLWEHEVVELFLAGPDGPARPYTEIELSPHGHHLVLRLAGVRAPIASGLPLRYTVARAGDRWSGRAWLDATLLPAPIAAFNAYAIHGLGADRRYLAAHPVPGPAPDFHRLHHFPTWPG